MIAAALLAGCAAAPPATCPLQIAADFPVTFLDGRQAIVTIHISGQDFKLLVDSGSDDSYLTTAAYERLNNDVPGEARISGYSTGMGGTVQENFAFIHDVTFGNTRLRGQVFLVNDYIVPTEHGVQPADGILDNDILHQFNVAYDFPGHRITLYYLQNCTSGLTPWAGDYDAEPITENHRTLTQTLPYSIDGQTFAVGLDTGASISLIKRSALESHHVMAEADPSGASMRLVGAGEHPFTVSREQFHDIGIGAESFGDSWLAVTNSKEPSDSDGLIGDDYLLRHRVFIETDSETAYFGLTVPGS